MERVPDVRTELGSDEATEGDWERDKGSTVSSISSPLPVQHLLLLIAALVRAPQCHTVSCTVSPEVGATYRECRSDKGFTVKPNTRPQHHTGLERTKRGLNMSTSHKYKSTSTQRCVWTQAAVQRDTDSHLRSFLTLVLFVPWHKDVCSNALCAQYCHFDLRIISILPLPPLSYCFFYLVEIWTLVQIYANSTNTPMDTCMSSIVKNSFKGIDTAQQVQSLADSSQCCW